MFVGSDKILKTVCIVTWHKVLNYGAQLQAYAMKKVLEQYNYEVVFYDYTRKMHKHNIYTMTRNPFRALHNFLRHEEMSDDEESFYNNKKDVLSDFATRYFSKADPNKIYDVCLIGADEIFSISDGFNDFQFGKGIKSDKLISYAASFGNTTYGMIRFFRKQNEISYLLNNFYNLSVRDENSRKIVEKLIRIPPRIDIDPVLLWTWDNEKNLFEQAPMDILLFYSYGTHDITLQEKDEIIAFARTNKLRIVSAGYYHSWCDENLCLESMEFVEYIYRAKYVVTTTFHGSVFSILFHKQFAVILQNTNCEKLGYLLEEFDANSHIVGNKTLDQILELTDNYDEYLVKKRREAHSYLEKIMK